MVGETSGSYGKGISNRWNPPLTTFVGALLLGLTGLMIPLIRTIQLDAPWSVGVGEGSKGVFCLSGVLSRSMYPLASFHLQGSSRQVGLPSNTFDSECIIRLAERSCAAFFVPEFIHCGSYFSQRCSALPIRLFSCAQRLDRGRTPPFQKLRENPCSADSSWSKFSKRFPPRKSLSALSTW